MITPIITPVPPTIELQNLRLPYFVCNRVQKHLRAELLDAIEKYRYEFEINPYYPNSFSLIPFYPDKLTQNEVLYGGLIRFYNLANSRLNHHKLLDKWLFEELSVQNLYQLNCEIKNLDREYFIAKMPTLKDIMLHCMVFRPYPPDIKS